MCSVGLLIFEQEPNAIVLILVPLLEKKTHLASRVLNAELP